MSLGTMALEDGGRVDFARLRLTRRARVFAAMEEHGIDVLLVGREHNARYTSGARRLFVAGTRPFAPGCVAVRATGEVHVLSTWDDGIPAEIPHEHLMHPTWNPQTLAAQVGAIEGVRGARRIGTDCMTPMFAALLPAVVGEFEFVDAERILREIRRQKTADEVTCIRTAVAIAESALLAATQAIRPGVRERELRGVFEARMSAFGTTSPATEGVCCVIDPDMPHLRQLPSARLIQAGQLVAIGGGVLYAGYEGSLGRTLPCVVGHRPAHWHEQQKVARRWSALWPRLADACRPGATGADLRAAYEASGEPLPDFPVAYSVGLGYEAPLAGTSLGPEVEAQWTLQAGTVLGVQGYLPGPAGGYYALETVHITDGGPEVLSTLSHGPLLDD